VGGAELTLHLNRKTREGATPMMASTGMVIRETVASEVNKWGRLASARRGGIEGSSLGVPSFQEAMLALEPPTVKPPTGGNDSPDDDLWAQCNGCEGWFLIKRRDIDLIGRRGGNCKDCTRVYFLRAWGLNPEDFPR